MGRRYFLRDKRTRTPAGARRQGLKAEERVLRALQDKPPDFVEHIRKATREEDASGIDIVATTNRCGRHELYVQVKRSEAGATRFKLEHRFDERPICVIVAPPGMPHEILRRRAHEKLRKLRMYVLYLADGGEPIPRFSPARVRD